MNMLVPAANERVALAVFKTFSFYVNSNIYVAPFPAAPSGAQYIPAHN